MVLPTANEEATIESVISEIRGAFAEEGLSDPVLIIVDDSNDATRSIASQLGVHVVIGGGKGLGYAMQRGWKASLAFDPEIIVSMDADGQSDPGELGRFLAPLAANEADLVLGSRFVEPNLVKYPYRWINRIGTSILARILRGFTGLPITDSHGGIRAMRPEVVREFDIVGTHTYVQESIIDAHEKGFRIVEVPSSWRPRLQGKSRVVGSIPKYIMYTLPILLVRSGVHIRWLYTLGLWLISAAVLYFFFITLQAGFEVKQMFTRLPSFVLIALLVMVGVQLFSFGFTVQLTKDIKSRVDRLDHTARPRDSSEPVKERKHG